MANRNARYKLAQAFAANRWRVQRLRRNRFAARELSEGAVEAAAAADGDIGAAVSEAADALADSDDAAGAGGDADEENAGEENAGDEDEDEDAGDAIGAAADGSSDAVLEDVLFVRALSRAPQHLTATGQRRPYAAWYEIVPKPRVAAVLRSAFHAGDGALMTTAATLYAQVAQRYIGIAHADVRAFLAAAETAALSRSNAIGDAIIAPSLPTRLGERWSADVTFSDGTVPTGPFVGFITVVDALSRFAWTRPVRNKEAATIAAFMEDLFLAEGAPEALHLDSAMEHKSQTMRLLAQRYSVRLRFTLPYKSQQNGGVERVHQTLKALLRRAILDMQGGCQAADFDAVLASITRQYNAAPHRVTGMPPFLLQRGRPPPTIGPPVLLRPADDEDDFRLRLLLPRTSPSSPPRRRAPRRARGPGRRRRRRARRPLRPSSWGGQCRRRRKRRRPQEEEGARRARAG